MLQVQKRMCKTCIYRPDSPLDLKELESQVADPRMEGHFAKYRECHHAKAEQAARIATLEAENKRLETVTQTLEHELEAQEEENDLSETEAANLRKESERLQTRITELELEIRACKFDEADYEKPDHVKRYHKEIMAAHPMQTGKHKDYQLALELVSERHSKYDLVDLVNWLLSYIPALPPEREQADD